MATEFYATGGTDVAITLTPGENSSRVRAGNDLNPFISIDLRYMLVPARKDDDKRDAGTPPGDERLRFAPSLAAEVPQHGPAAFPRLK